MMISACVLFELLGLVFNYNYVDLQYNDISLTFTDGSFVVWVCSYVVDLGLSVIFSWYPMWWLRGLLFVWHVSMLRDYARVMTMLVWGWGGGVVGMRGMSIWFGYCV